MKTLKEENKMKDKDIFITTTFKILVEIYGVSEDQVLRHLLAEQIETLEEMGALSKAQLKKINAAAKKVHPQYGEVPNDLFIP